jgi:hypothetical protein
MDFISVVVGFRHTAIDSVIDSVDGGVRWRVIDSVIDSVLTHVQNDLLHAQQIIDSAGRYTLFFTTESMANFKAFYSPCNEI